MAYFEGVRAGPEIVADLAYAVGANVWAGAVQATSLGIGDLPQVEAAQQRADRANEAITSSIVAGAAETKDTVVAAAGGDREAQGRVAPTVVGAILTLGRSLLTRAAARKVIRTPAQAKKGPGAGKLSTSQGSETAETGEAAFDTPSVSPQRLSFVDIVADPTLLYGKTADEVGAILGEGWTRASYGRTGTGWKFYKDDKSIFYNEGGRHATYWGVSKANIRKTKVVGDDYVPTADDKARIIRYDDK